MAMVSDWIHQVEIIIPELNGVRPQGSQNWKLHCLLQFLCPICSSFWTQFLLELMEATAKDPLHNFISFTCNGTLVAHNYRNHNVVTTVERLPFANKSENLESHQKLGLGRNLTRKRV